MTEDISLFTIFGQSLLITSSSNSTYLSLPTTYSCTYLQCIKEFTKGEFTQGSLLTLSGIGKFSRLLRPVGPGFMFSVYRTEKFGACHRCLDIICSAQFRLCSASLRNHLRAISLKTRTDYRFVRLIRKSKDHSNPSITYPIASLAFLPSLYQRTSDEP